MKKVLVQGPIPPEKIARSVSAHQDRTGIGAHSIFLGQIRADSVEGKRVTGIEYTAYEEMAEKVFHDIREAAFAKFDLNCAHMYHSLGRINVGELCLFVFTSSAHRRIAMEATGFLVEEIKSKVPVFGKEIFEDMSHQWKVNT